MINLHQVRSKPKGWKVIPETLPDEGYSYLMKVFPETLPDEGYSYLMKVIHTR
jgi:hypothetical protein